MTRLLQMCNLINYFCRRMAYHNILLIDDDVEDRTIFRNALREVHPSATFTEMNDARKALNALSEIQLTPDVIFLDLNMPEMNGLEFLLEVKKNAQLAPIHVIVFTTSSHKPTMELAKDLGAKDFVTKPNRISELLQILRTHVCD